MADVKISALPASTTPLAGTEVLPIVQSSTTKQVSVANLTAGRAVSASSLTLTTPLSAANGGTGLSSLGTNVATALGNATNGASGICVLDASGNLGIGVTPSAWGNAYGSALQVLGGALLGVNGNIFDVSQNTYLDNVGFKYIATAAATVLRQEAGVYKFFNAPSGTAGNAINFVQAMTLDANANLLIGTTDTGLSSGDGIKLNPSGNTTSVPYIAVVGNSTSSTHYCYTLRSTSTGTWRFYIDYAGTVFAQSTTITSLSDARHKENIRELDQGLEAILALKPRRFDWKEGKGNGKKNVAGFVAQEVEPIFPDLIAPFKDDDMPDLKGLAMGGMLPAVVKAIQELAAEVAMLKGQLNG